MRINTEYSHNKCVTYSQKNCKFDASFFSLTRVSTHFFIQPHLFFHHVSKASPSPPSVSLCPEKKNINTVKPVWLDSCTKHTHYLNLMWCEYHKEGGWQVHKGTCSLQSRLKVWPCVRALYWCVCSTLAFFTIWYLHPSVHKGEVGTCTLHLCSSSSSLSALFLCLLCPSPPPTLLPPLLYSLLLLSLLPVSPLLLLSSSDTGRMKHGFS